MMHDTINKIISPIIIFSLIFAMGTIDLQKVYASTTYTVSTGGTGSWTVPAGVTSVQIELWGADGSSSANGYFGGAGAYILETGLSVTLGSSITYDIASGSSGYRDGGAGGSDGNVGNYDGGDGGGSSSVVVSGTTYIASGGGGGSGGGSGIGAISSSGGKGGPGSSKLFLGGGGGGGSGTYGSPGSWTGGAGGTGGTSQTGSSSLSSTIGQLVITYVLSLTSISISGVPAVGSELTSTVAPAGSTATYQWQRATTSGGTYTAISGATSSYYTPVSGDLGYYIEVVATGSGSYSGTVTSSPTAVVAATPSPTRIMMLFNGFRIKFISGRIILEQKH